MFRKVLQVLDYLLQKVTMLFVVLAGLMLLTHVRALPWSDERWLFAEAVSKQPNCAECWNNLAFAEAVRGHYRQAARDSLEGLSIDTRRYRGARDGFSLRWILAKSLLLSDQGRRAIPWLMEIISKVGATPANLEMLAQAYALAGKPYHALLLMSQAVHLAPADTLLRKKLAGAFRSAIRPGSFPTAGILWWPIED